VVSGKPLGEKPVNAVVGNRLVRVVDESEKATLAKDPAKDIAELDKAAMGKQKADYPLKSGMVRGGGLGSAGEGGDRGGGGRAGDMVVAGRLVRLCCKDCVKDVEKEPAKYVAKVDEARKGKGEAKKEGEEKK